MKFKNLKTNPFSFFTAVTLFVLSVNATAQPERHEPIESKIYEKDHDMGRLGVIKMTADSRYKAPGFLAGDTGGELGLNMKVSHNIPDFSYDFISIKVKGSTTDIRNLRPGPNTLGELSIDFSGLLFTGLPNYISNTEGLRDLKNKGFTFKTYNDDKGHATLSKKVIVNIDGTLIRDLKEKAGRIEELKLQIENLPQDGSIPDWESKLSRAKEEYLRIIQEKENLVKRLSSLEVPCFPQFKKTVKFPIFERGVETPDSGAGSASAKFGVSGDVVVQVIPTCGITIGSQATIESFVRTQINVLSHGFFGARADASGSFSLFAEFEGDYGKYTLPRNILGTKEKEIMKALILNSVMTVKDMEAVNEELLNFLKTNLDFTEKVEDLILEAVVGTLATPVSLDKICELIRKNGVPEDSEPDLICKFASEAIPEEPVLNIPPFEDPVLEEVCKAEIPLPNALCQEDFFGNYLPPGCDEAVKATNRARRAVCDKNDQIIAAAKAVWEREKKRLEDLHAKAMERFLKIVKFKNPLTIFNVARSWAHGNILVAGINEKLSKIIIDLVWKVDEKGRIVVDTVDLINAFVNENFLQYVTVKVEGSARIAFFSTAHLFEMRPMIEQKLNIGLDPFGAPLLKSDLRFYKHSDPERKGRIGGLNVLGFKLTAELKASALGREVSWKVEDKPIFRGKTLGGSEYEAEESNKSTFELPMQNIQAPILVPTGNVGSSLCLDRDGFTAGACRLRDRVIFIPQEDGSYCLQKESLLSIRQRGFIGIRRGIFSRKCGPGEKWILIHRGEGRFCLQNQYLQQAGRNSFLRPNGSYGGTCDQGEEWGIHKPQLPLPGGPGTGKDPYPGKKDLNLDSEHGFDLDLE